MRVLLAMVLTAFCLAAAAGCAPVNNGEYDDYRGGGFHQ